MLIPAFTPLHDYGVIASVLAVHKTEHSHSVLEWLSSTTEKDYEMLVAVIVNAHFKLHAVDKSVLKGISFTNAYQCAIDKEVPNYKTYKGGIVNLLTALYIKEMNSALGHNQALIPFDPFPEVLRIPPALPFYDLYGMALASHSKITTNLDQSIRTLDTNLLHHASGVRFFTRWATYTYLLELGMSPVDIEYLLCNYLKPYPMGMALTTAINQGIRQTVANIMKSDYIREVGIGG